MILPIHVYGQPVLRKVAQDITPEYEGLGQLIQDVPETLDSSDGIGLAAPQIGKSIRVVIISLNVLNGDFPEYKDFRHVYINPHIVETDENAPKESMGEGCLSTPGIHEAVSRTIHIHVQYVDEDFTLHDEWIEDYLARVMQHESDHLDGKMFVGHISPFRRQVIKSKLKGMTQGKYECHYRTEPIRE